MMQPTKFMFFVSREQRERALTRGLEASHQNQRLLWKWLEGRGLILASLMHTTHVLFLKVRKREIAGRVGPVFFLLPRITSEAPPESLQCIHLLMHSFTLPSDKYPIVPTSCQALSYGPETQGEQGKQHPCFCNMPVSSLEVSSPGGEVPPRRAFVYPAVDFT